MRRLLSYFLVFVSACALCGCEGQTDVTSDPYYTPEGVVRIFADRTSISADGADAVNFKVMYGSQDVSSEATCNLIRTYNGEDKSMPYGASTFSTTVPGTYTFTARYYYSGAKYSENSVEVVAEEYFTGEEKDYARKVLGVMFTSTGCQSCPSAARKVKALQEENPGEISIVAFHDHMTVEDPMYIPYSTVFRSALADGDPSLPRLFWNMRKGTYMIGLAGDIEDGYEAECKAYSPLCGVSINTTLNGSELTVEAGITSNTRSTYRCLMFIVEDGITGYAQMDSMSDGKDYVHSNVVRTVLSPNDSAWGYSTNDGLPYQTGVEVKCTKTVTLSPDWNVENIRVVVAALNTEDGGNSYVVNNINECMAGEASSYIYNE